MDEDEHINSESERLVGAGEEHKETVRSSTEDVMHRAKDLLKKKKRLLATIAKHENEPKKLKERKIIYAHEIAESITPSLNEHSDVQPALNTVDPLAKTATIEKYEEAKQLAVQLNGFILRGMKDREGSVESKRAVDEEIKEKIVEVEARRKEAEKLEVEWRAVIRGMEGLWEEAEVSTPT